MLFFSSFFWRQARSGTSLKMLVHWIPILHVDATHPTLFVQKWRAVPQAPPARHVVVVGQSSSLRPLTRLCATPLQRRPLCREEASLQRASPPCGVHPARTQINHPAQRSQPPLQHNPLHRALPSDPFALVPPSSALVPPRRFPQLLESLLLLQMQFQQWQQDLAAQLGCLLLPHHPFLVRFSRHPSMSSRVHSR